MKFTAMSMAHRMERLVEVFQGAQEYIKNHGWTKGKLHDVDDGGVCLVGGMIYGQGLYEYTDDELDLMAADYPEMAEAIWMMYLQIHPEYLREADDEVPIADVTAWNDSESRKLQEVEDLLAKCEKIAKAGFDPDAA